VEQLKCLPIGYLWCALENFFRIGTPLRDTLPLLERLRLAIPKMKEIWEFPTMAMEQMGPAGQKGMRDMVFQQALWFEEDARKGIADGKLTLESQILPERLQGFRHEMA